MSKIATTTSNPDAAQTQTDSSLEAPAAFSRADAYIASVLGAVSSLEPGMRDSVSAFFKSHPAVISTGAKVQAEGAALMSEITGAVASDGAALSGDVGEIALAVRRNKSSDKN